MDTTDKPVNEAMLNGVHAVDPDAPASPADAESSSQSDGAAPGEPILTAVHDAVVVSVAGERVMVTDSLVVSVAAGELRAKDTLVIMCTAGAIEGENVLVLLTPARAAIIGAAFGIALALFGRLLRR